MLSYIPINTVVETFYQNRNDIRETMLVTDYQSCSSNSVTFSILDSQAVADKGEGGCALQNDIPYTVMQICPWYLKLVGYKYFNCRGALQQIANSL
jgi:hypothetical protein